jgi:hypothetical protein
MHLMLCELLCAAAPQLDVTCVAVCSCITTWCYVRCYVQLHHNLMLRALLCAAAPQLDVTCVAVCCCTTTWCYVRCCVKLYHNLMLRALLCAAVPQLDVTCVAVCSCTTTLFYVRCCVQLYHNLILRALLCAAVPQLAKHLTWPNNYGSGFGGLMVSMLASGTQNRGFAPGRKNPQQAFLRKGSKAVCPMSQIWGM